MYIRGDLMKLGIVRMFSSLHRPRVFLRIAFFHLSNVSLRPIIEPVVNFADEIVSDRFFHPHNSQSYMTTPND